jgi:hypothetical protein
MIAPFTRQIKLRDKGDDVLAVKRALVRAHYGGRGMLLTKFMGEAAMRNVHRFQHAHSLPVGAYDYHTHKVLSPYFDARGRQLLNNYLKQGVRQRIVEVAIYDSLHNSLMHYTQGPQRMYGVRNRIRPPEVPKYEDCSSFATYCYWVAGAPDPNGLHYNGYGYTGTQIDNGRRVANPSPGDICFYGWGYNGAPKHEALYIGSGKIVSHGSDSGPQIRSSIRYRSDFREARTYLS